MSTVNTESHSFIIKVWLEETKDANGTISWRGHITHVPDGVRRYVKSLSDILGFIKPYLEGLGADIKQHRQPRWWMKPWKRKK